MSKSGDWDAADALLGAKGDLNHHSLFQVMLEHFWNFCGKRSPRNTFAKLANQLIFRAELHNHSEIGIFSKVQGTEN